MKRKFIYLIPIVLVLSSFGPTAEVEQLNYEVVVYNRTIGTFTATRTDLNGRSDFRLESKITARIIKKIDFVFDMQSSFENSSLVKSRLSNWMNDKLRSSSSVSFDGSKYEIILPKKTLTFNKSSIDYSSASLYFEEPIGRAYLFSENYGINLPIKNVGAHKYLVKLPNGDKNYYLYENGQVVSVEFDKSIINIKMKIRAS